MGMGWHGMGQYSGDGDDVSGDGEEMGMKYFTVSSSSMWRYITEPLAWPLLACEEAFKSTDCTEAFDSRPRCMRVCSGQSLSSLFCQPHCTSCPQFWQHLSSTRTHCNSVEGSLLRAKWIRYVKDNAGSVNEVCGFVLVGEIKKIFV